MTYYSNPAISNSRVTTFIDDGPDGYYRKYIERSWPDKEPTEEMKLGTAVHAVIVENRDLDSVVMQIPPDVLSASGSRAGGAWKAFAAENADKLLLKTHEYAEFLTIIAAVRSNPYARRLLAEESQRECELFWHDDAVGLDRKAKLDMLGSTFIADLKIVNDVSPSGFAKLAYQRGYHRQAAYYRDAVRARIGDPLPFIFLAAMNCEPYSVACYDLGDEFIANGADQVDEALHAIARCHASGEWYRPGFDSLVTLQMPRWAKYQDEYAFTEE